MVIGMEAFREVLKGMRIVILLSVVRPVIF